MHFFFILWYPWVEDAQFLDISNEVSRVDISLSNYSRLNKKDLIIANYGLDSNLIVIFWYHFQNVPI